MPSSGPCSPSCPNHLATQDGNVAIRAGGAAWRKKLSYLASSRRAISAVPVAQAKSGFRLGGVVVNMHGGSVPGRRAKTKGYDYYRVRSVERALGILDLFTRERPHWTLADIDGTLGMHRSTVHRLVLTLERQRYLRRDATGNSYSLAVKPITLGAVALESLEFRKVVRPHLERLCLATGQTVDLGVLEDGDVVYLDEVMDAARGQFRHPAGTKAPAHGTALGKVLLAALPTHTQREILSRKPLRRYTSHTVTDVETLLKSVKEVGERGYALDLGEYEYLVSSVAAPIRDPSGAVIAALSLLMIGPDLSEETLARYISQVVSTAAEASSDSALVSTDR